MDIGTLIVDRGGNAAGSGDRLVCSILFLSVFFALFFPYIDISSFPLHISVPILFFALLVLASFKGVGRNYIVLLLLIITIPFGGGLFSVLSGYDLQFSKLMYSSLPVVVLSISFYVAYRLTIRTRTVQIYLIFIAAVFSLILVLQNFPFFRNFFSMVGLIPDHRIGFFDSYYIVIAPMANPNNSGLIAALLIMALVFFNYKVYTASTSIYIRTVVVIICFVLFFGLIFSYARTVLAGFLVSFAMLLYTGSSFRAKLNILCLGVAAIVGLTVYFSGKRELIYYMTIFSFQDDGSFTSRYYFWVNVLQAFQDNPYSVFVGFGRYQDVIVYYQESTVIDSSYLYFVAQYGLFVTLAFIVFSLRAAAKVHCFISFMPLFLLSSVTLAYFTDVRMNIVIGFILGLVCNYSGFGVRSIHNRSACSKGIL